MANELGTALEAAAASARVSPRTELHPTFYWNDPRGLAAVAVQDGLHARLETAVRTDQLWNQLFVWVGWGETVIIWRVLDGYSAGQGHYTVVDGVDDLGVHVMDPWPEAPPYDHIAWARFYPQFHNRLLPGGLAIRISALPTPWLY
jgi:hypothetical protein